MSHRIPSVLNRLLYKVSRKLGKDPRMRFVPSLPAAFRRRYSSPRQPWGPLSVDVPAELLDVAGIRRDTEAEQRAYDQSPLRDFTKLHGTAHRWLVGAMWRSMLPVSPRLSRARVAVRGTDAVQPVAPGTDDPARLTEHVRAFAAAAGMSALGVARYDPKYTYAEYQDVDYGDRVICCVLEQNYDATQAIPSAWSEQTALSTYGELMEQATGLAAFLHERGYRAAVQEPAGKMIMIHYAVAAGLGQLGLNGQLLTPQAGSRCRIILLTTDAPLLLDEPVDYGIHGICDRCQVCVRRCPVGAIPKTRSDYRGVVKAKLNTKRCFPIVAQVDGCAICMKVCPVQRYGLPAVLDEYGRSGRILGKDTEELESYRWPLDGRRYGVGERPRVPADLVAPPGLPLEAMSVRGGTDGLD